jgi:hypothetical protein
MRTTLLAILLAMLLVPSPAGGQSTRGGDDSAPAADPRLEEMNVWLQIIQPKSRASTYLWPAWEKTTPMPGDGRIPMPADIWSGMPEAKAWQDWAAANAPLTKAIAESKDCLALAVPYGTPDAGDSARAAGLLALPGSAVGEAAFPYLRALRGIAAYSVLEMQRLGEQGKFDEAFEVGVNGLRVVRQAAQQRTALEKAVALELLVSALEAHRCFMADHLDRIPLKTMERVALKEYPFIRSGDGEKLKRLEMPEGDVTVASMMFEETFGADGQPDAELFAARFGAAQAADAPLTRFGAAAQWRTVAGMHGSSDASRQRMVDVFDDWWRRWRMPPYDPMNEMPSEYSRLNPVRYAAVSLLASEMERVFRLRTRVAAEIDGTCVAAALCGFWLDNGKQWPRDLGPVFPLYGVRRMNMDPYSRRYGSFEYRDAGSRPQPIDTPWGQVTATGGILWSVGGDHEDGGVAKHDPPDGIGDIVMWPPPRQLARKAGLMNP